MDGRPRAARRLGARSRHGRARRAGPRGVDARLLGRPQYRRGGRRDEHDGRRHAGAAVPGKASPRARPQSPRDPDRPSRPHALEGAPMTKHTLIDRLMNADPAAGRDVVDDPALHRARIDAILGSAGPDPLALPEPAADTRPPASGGSRYRRAAIIAVAALAIPGAALAASAAFGPDDVERGLPAGAQLLVGTDPHCAEVERDTVYDCKLGEAPVVEGAQAGDAQPPWLGAVSLIVDRAGRINGGCRSPAGGGMAWGCYIGAGAPGQQIMGPPPPRTPLHGHFEGSPPGAPPGASP